MRQSIVCLQSYLFDGGRRRERERISDIRLSQHSIARTAMTKFSSKAKRHIQPSFMDMNSRAYIQGYYKLKVKALLYGKPRKERSVH